MIPSSARRVDDVAELEASGQSALLRLLQSSRAPRFRLVASTRHDLERETTVGTFRKDPFYRLNVLELRSTLQRMLILSPGGRLDVDALPERIPR